MDTFDLESKIEYTPKVLVMEYILLKYHNFLKSKLEDKNLSRGDLVFLYNIFYHEPLSQRELAELLFVSEAYVTKMLKKLEKKEYIERKVDDEIKSKKIIYLTDKGHVLTLDFVKITREWENDLMDLLDYDYKGDLNKVLFNLAYNAHKLE